MLDHPRTKSAQVNLRLRPDLKAMAEKAAAADHRSLTSLIEKLLTDYLRRKGHLNNTAGSPTRTKGAPRAAEMAGHELNKLGDETATDEERSRRKRALIAGPKEFRGMRRK
jgi:hypothetical protein